MKNNCHVHRILFIMHRTPPVHGAAKVGDLVYTEAQKIENIETSFISIRSSSSVNEIGIITFKKLILFFKLFTDLIITLHAFRPTKIYYTPSVSGIALYRDVLLSCVWKAYCIFSGAEVYFHYHQRGIEKSIRTSNFTRLMINWFHKNVRVITLGRNACNEFGAITWKKDAVIVPNAAPDIISGVKNIDGEKACFDILYLSNMIKTKGYFRLLELAPKLKDKGYKFHFAGSWTSKIDELEFFEFVDKHDLSQCITYYGFADGDRKIELFQKADLLALPTNYKLESAPLCLIEALSFGVPCISTKLGDIPSIITQDCGILLDDLSELEDAIIRARKDYYSDHVSNKCREHYEKYYSTNAFRENLFKELLK